MDTKITFVFKVIFVLRGYERVVVSANGFLYSFIVVKPQAMKLSTEARNELREILVMEIGSKRIESLSDDEIENLGMFFLALFYAELKISN